MTILDQLAAYARVRVEADQAVTPFEAMKELAAGVKSAPGCLFLQALQKPGLSFICEIKKASPSKGLIDPDFPYLDIAHAYEEAGADCVSCLTEPKWFLGSDEIFTQVRAHISLPMLRKDFTIDPYQIYQAKVMGANAILLICSLLEEKTIAEYLAICADLGMAALVEAHTQEEIKKAVNAGAAIIGVNNRNLNDFSVDFSNAARLRDLIPPSVLYVAESGVSDAKDIQQLHSIGADAVLIGETLMRAPDKRRRMEELRRFL